MFKKTLYISIVVALLSVTASADNRQKGHQNGKNRGQSQNVTVSELTLEQKEGLIFMIEEEKVARDVYTTLYNKWGIRVFTNIAKSEQKHMDAVENILNQYDLEIPLTLDTVGIFEDEQLQVMYNDLIVKGNSSLIDALEVAVLIEEVDIADLQELIQSNVPSNIKKVYNNLLNGSYKHLRAFNRQLSKQ